MAGQISADPLFVGLTRPTMIFGVSIQYAMLNLMISVLMFQFLNLPNLLVLYPFLVQLMQVIWINGVLTNRQLLIMMLLLKMV